jgi:hypothetical protein
VRRSLELGDLKFLSQGVEARMFQQLVAGIINGWKIGIGFEAIGTVRQTAREVFASVLVLQKATEGIQGLVWES